MTQISPQGPHRLSDLPSEPDAFGLSPFERAAMRQRRAVLRGRDAPDQNTDPATLASFAASFIPGAGLADLLGSMPDFRGGVGPSFLENLRQGDRLAAALQIAGVVPGVGGVVKVIRKAPTGKWAKYAERYPEVGEPALYDKATGKRISSEADALFNEKKAYLGKSLPPEVQEFQRDRIAIQNDMDANGYHRVFDTSKRAEVDPKNYPTEPDILASTMPVKAATAEKYREHYRTNGSVDRLVEAYQKGKDAPGGKLWYALRQVEDKFVEEYGPVIGREQFRTRFVVPLAATTAGNSPRQNFLTAHHAAVENQAGRRLPQESFELPYPIGGQYAGSNSRMAQSQFDDGIAGFDATHPKRYSFERAILGDRDVYVIDSSIADAIDPGVQAPRYYALASEVMEEARKRVGAKDAREFNDAVWAGLGGHHDLLAIDEINQMIERTHRLTGMPRDEIVKRGLIRKEIPMYGVGGAILAPTIGYGVMNGTSPDGGSRLGSDSL